MPVSCDDTHQEGLKVAVSNSPDKKFEYVKDIAEPFSIDAHVVKNNVGLYIFYSINDYSSEKAGTYIVCDEMKDPFNVSGHPKTMVVPTIKEEIFEKNRFMIGQDWYTIEGAFYFKNDNWHYLIYSANSYLKPEYHLGYCVCNAKNDRLNKLNFKKISKNRFLPLLTGDETEESTGHNSMIKYNGRYYIIYHARDKNTKNDKVESRTARICQLIVDNGKLTVVKL